MKKMLFSAAALFCSFAALAQTPAPSAKHANKAVAADHKLEAKAKRNDQDRSDDKAGTPDNHGQAVQTLAHSTTLTGAEKGAAISTLASGGRSAAKGQSADHSARGARGERSARGGNRNAGNRPAGAGHQGAGHRGGAGRGR
ncbi:hypothetical protein ACFQT0_07150 [Hymenobacter humi]|uniref:Uncharacterized protein n=1 Tax=Hymenobacter humi TaxID=1411620 RepID=A0ABW2U2V2_9BACT